MAVVVVVDECFDFRQHLSTTEDRFIPEYQTSTNVTWNKHKY